MTPQTYAWEWGHPQFDPDNHKAYTQFERENPYATGSDYTEPTPLSSPHIPGTRADIDAVSTNFPNYPY